MFGPHYSDERFKKTFRVSKETFKFILNRICEDLERNTINEYPISPECRLGICLYRLSRGDIAEMAGLGISTVQSIVTRVCYIIVEKLWQEHERYNVAVSFCWAAVDGCHILIKCPPGGAEARKEYYNFKHFYSIVLMALVDSKYNFASGSCGFPGNSHDAVILQSTNIWVELKGQGFIPNIGRKMGDVTVPHLLLLILRFQCNLRYSSPMLMQS